MRPIFRCRSLVGFRTGLADVHVDPSGGTIGVLTARWFPLALQLVVAHNGPHRQSLPDPTALERAKLYAFPCIQRPLPLRSRAADTPTEWVGAQISSPAHLATVK